MSLFKEFSATKERTSVAILYGAEIVNVLSLLVIIVTIARIGTAKELGRFNFSLAIIAPVFMFLWMQIRTILASDVDRRFSTPSYYTSRALSVFTGLAISTSLALVTQPLDFLPAFVALAISKSIESFSDLNAGVFLRAGRQELVAAFKILRALSVSVTFVLVYKATDSLSAALYGSAMASALALMVEFPLIIGIEQRIIPKDFRESLSQAKELVSEAYPLGFLELLYAIQGNTPKYLLMYLSGEVIVGIYSSLVYMLRPGALLATSAFQASIRKLSLMHRSNNTAPLKRALAVLIVSAIGISTIMTATFWWFGKPLLTLALGANFSNQAGFLTLISLNNFAALPAAMVSYYGIIRRRYKGQPLVVAFTILINACAGWVLGHRLGEIGIVIGWIISSFVLLAGQIHLVRGKSS